MLRMLELLFRCRASGETTPVEALYARADRRRIGRKVVVCLSDAEDWPDGPTGFPVRRAAKIGSKRNV